MDTSAEDPGDLARNRLITGVDAKLESGAFRNQPVSVSPAWEVSRSNRMGRSACRQIERGLAHGRVLLRGGLGRVTFAASVSSGECAARNRGLGRPPAFLIHPIP